MVGILGSLVFLNKLEKNGIYFFLEFVFVELKFKSKERFKLKFKFIFRYFYKKVIYKKKINIGICLFIMI